MPTIHIRQWPTPLFSRRGTILDAALAAGVPFPHGCRDGTCGACKTKILSGEALSLSGPTVQAPAPGDATAGIVLACRSWPRTDVSVEWLANGPAEADGARRLAAEIVSIDRPRPDLARIRLAPRGSRLDFRPGQYARFRFGNLPERNYSMASLPTDELLELHVRALPGGLVGNHLLYRARAGDRVQIDGPFGDAYWRPGHGGPIVLAATGAGLAPIKSILRAALQHWNPGQRIFVFIGVKEERNVYGEETLSRLVGNRAAVRIIYSLSKPTAPTWRRIGLLQDIVTRDIPDFANVVTYAAGAPAMVQSLAALARRRNAAPENIRIEPFYDQAANGEFIPSLPRLKKLRRFFR